MRLDPVGDLQKVFRKLMRSMSRPGTLADLSEEALKLDLPFSINKALLLAAMSLLDAEVTFDVASRDGVRASAAELVSKLTYARLAPPGAADYILVPGGGRGAAPAILAARAGTLIDPHLGATLLIEAERIAEGGPLLLSGPGIDGTATLGLELETGWIEARESKNAEYPLGVDLVFVDSEYRLAAIPRTTRITQGRS
jgi:alpha-D-ribose 1-methylphosphonate 5-triphosphate synthase subunit PhnH